MGILVLMYWIWLAGLLILPFWFWPGAAVPYEVPKVYFLWRWVELLWLWGLVGFVRARKVNRLDTLGTWILAGYIGVAVMASWLGVDWHKSVFGNYYRADGLLTLFHLVGLAAWVACFWRNEWIGPTKKVLVGGGLGLAGLALAQALLQWVGWLPPSGWEGGSVGATFGQPNFLGGYLTVIFPLLFDWLRRRRFWYIWLGLYAGGLVVTQAKTAIVLALGYGLVWWVWKRWPRNVKSAVMGSVVGVIGLVGGWLVIHQPADVPDSRLRMVMRSVLGWETRPWLGWGWANVDHAVESVVWPMPYLHDVYVDKAHSTLLEALVTTGVWGLAAYLVLIGAVGWRLWRRPTWFGVLVLFLLHAQTNVISINEELIFWTLLGMAGSGRLRLGRTNRG